MATVRESLPWAWSTVEGLAVDLHAGTAEYAEHRTPPPTEQAWGEMLLPDRGVPAGGGWVG